MYLTEEEKRILAGEEGEAKQQAMRILVDYGEALGADKLVEISDATISVKGMLPSGMLADREFASMNELFSWANLAADKTIDKIGPVSVRRCSLLSANLSKEYLDYLGITDPRYEASIDATREFIRKLGVNECVSCTPQLIGHMPAKGEHTTSNESSQAIFQNSVLGARVNCESMISSSCAALVGRIPNTGMHLDGNRMGTHLVKVDKIPKMLYEWDLLGYWIGKHVRIGVPVLDINVPYITMDEHKSLGASMCTSGQVDMYHVIGLTPEAGTYDLAFGTNTPKAVLHYGLAEEEETLRKLNWAAEGDVDFVMMGCPNYSIFQLQEISRMLEGRTCKARLMILASRMIIDQARINGDAQKIEEAGGFLMPDSCPIILYLWPEDIHVMATDSGKLAHYVPSSRPDLKIHLGSMQRCIDSAVNGKW